MSKWGNVALCVASTIGAIAIAAAIHGNWVGALDAAFGVALGVTLYAYFYEPKPAPVDEQLAAAIRERDAYAESYHELCKLLHVPEC